MPCLELGLDNWLSYLHLGNMLRMKTKVQVQRVLFHTACTHKEQGLRTVQDSEQVIVPNSKTLIPPTFRHEDHTCGFISHTPSFVLHRDKGFQGDCEYRCLVRSRHHPSRRSVTKILSILPAYSSGSDPSLSFFLQQTPSVIFPCEPYSVDKSSVCWAVARQTMSVRAHLYIGESAVGKRSSQMCGVCLEPSPRIGVQLRMSRLNPKTRCPLATRRSEGLGALPFQEQALRGDRLRLRM